MEVLDRYLYEVRRYLPAAQQDDVIAEISDTLQSQVEEREQKLGRTLTSAEESEIIRDFGHPKVVASRYQPAQYLIGPDTFPFYWYTLKIVLVCALGLEIFGALIAAILGRAGLQTFFSPVRFPTFVISVVWPTLFLVFGTVTFIFAAIERTGSRATILTKLGVNTWNPAALPRPAKGEVPRFSLLFEAFANIVFILWLVNFAPLRRAVGFLISAAGGTQSLAPLAFTSNWQPLLVLAVAAAFLIAVQDFVLLVNPTLLKIRASTLLAANVLLVIGASLALRSHDFVTTHMTTPAYIEATKALNLVAYVFIAILLIGCLVAAFFNVRMLLHRVTPPDLNITPARTS